MNIPPHRNPWAKIECRPSICVDTVNYILHTDNIDLLQFCKNHIYLEHENVEDQTSMTNQISSAWMTSVCVAADGSSSNEQFPQNKSSTRFHGGWIHIEVCCRAGIINIFITIQYCGFMQTIGSSGGLSKSGKEKSQQQQHKQQYTTSLLCTMCDFHDFGLTWKCQKWALGCRIVKA